MVETASTLNPDIAVVMRSGSAQEAALLEREHGGKAFVGESELARAMTRYVLEHVASRG